jgi:hypothetical protein
MEHAGYLGTNSEVTNIYCGRRSLVESIGREDAKIKFPMSSNISVRRSLCYGSRPRKLLLWWITTTARIGRRKALSTVENASWPECANSSRKSRHCSGVDGKVADSSPRMVTRKINKGRAS